MKSKRYKDNIGSSTEDLNTNTNKGQAKKKKKKKNTMIFFHTNPITIFLFLTSLILSSHPYNFSAASDSEVGMFSLSLSYSYLFYFFIFSYDLWAMQTYNCLTSSSRSLIRILLVFISLCFRLEEWFLSTVCIDTYKDKKSNHFFLVEVLSLIKSHFD